MLVFMTIGFGDTPNPGLEDTESFTESWWESSWSLKKPNIRWESNIWMGLRGLYCGKENGCNCSYGVQWRILVLAVLYVRAILSEI
jgi:hypothetical protein